MIKKHRIQSALMIGLLAAWLAPGTATAQKITDAETREIESYVLTEAGLSKYAQATKYFNTHKKDMPKDCDSDDDSKSLAQLVARVNAIPAARAAVTSAGLTTREYFIFSFSLLQNGLAAWGLDQPGGKLPPGLSMANIKFIRAHQAAITKLNAASDSDSDDCDDRSSDDES